jgi:hypothetical protein
LRTDDDLRTEDMNPSFVKGIAFTFAILLLSFVVILIPVVNILSITMIPYLSTAIGARYARPRDRLPLALTTSVIWSLLETVIIVVIFNIPETPGGFYIDRIGLYVLVAVWLLNISFSILGSLHTWRDPFQKVREI